MPDLIVTDEQAKVIATSTAEIAVRDRHGKLLAHIAPLTIPDESQIIEEAKRRLASKQRRYSTADAVERIRKLEQE